MTKKYSIPYFENNYWQRVRNFTQSKLKEIFVTHRQTINKLLEVWHRQLRVNTTTGVSLNNAVFMYVTDVENIKIFISYLFFILAFLSPPHISAKIQEVLEYEEQHKGTLTTRLKQKEAPAWMPVQDSKTDPRVRFEQLPDEDDKVTTASDKTQPDSKNDFTSDKDTAGDRAGKARETKPLDSKTRPPDEDVPTPPAPDTLKERQALLRALRDHGAGHDPAGPYVC